MRKLLFLGLVCLLINSLPAQTTPRNGAQAAPAARSVATKTQPTTIPRTTAQPSGKNRNDNSLESLPNVENRAARPTRTTPPPTSKTVPAKMPDAPQLKQDEPLVKVEWLSLEEAMEKLKTVKRKVFVDVFTDWCGWCKRMDESTFADPQVAQYLNDNYYAVRLNAEQQQDIVFNNKTYHFRRNGARGYHELAAELLNNRLSFPTVVFLDENLRTIQPIPGYLEASKLETILHYFGTDSHKTTPWETYERKYNDGDQK
ncbi:MAG: DUF255 domain-containing protein [Saprospiraceae bacterium]|nr:DUF255 domain-containing protein [Saprospiraceae bacterium]